MHGLRKFMSWIYAISSLRCLQIALLRILAIQRDHTSLPLHNVLLASVFSVQAIIFGLAWWTVFRKEPSARSWGIIASLTYIVISLWSIINFSRSVWGAFGVLLAAGITGLIVFLWRDKHDGSCKNPREYAYYGPVTTNEPQSSAGSPRGHARDLRLQ
jgi:hypothetical protein